MWCGIGNKFYYMKEFSEWAAPRALDYLQKYEYVYTYMTDIFFFNKSFESAYEKEYICAIKIERLKSTHVSWHCWPF